MTVKAKVKADAGKPAKRRASTTRLSWRHVILKVRHTRDYLLQGQDHIELLVMAPKGGMLPVTETGYRSHFIAAAELAAAGGPARYVLAWLDREARTKRWQETQFRWRQLDIFG
jgi:hypothetical protein